MPERNEEDEVVGQSIEDLLNKPVDVRTIPEAEFDKLLLPVFCFAFCWTIGSTCDSKSRNQFARQ